MLRRLLPVVLSAAVLLACSPVVDEVEPNHDLAHASRLPANGRARGTISGPDEVDWYKISIDRDSGVLSLHVGGIRDIDFVLSFRDKDGRELMRVDETGVGGDEVAYGVQLLRFQVRRVQTQMDLLRESFWRVFQRHDFLRENFRAFITRIDFAHDQNGFVRLQ